jgi:hypothetical protein
MRACAAATVALSLIAFAAAGSALGAGLPLRTVARVPLSGPAVRFDYTSLDPGTNRLWISHMDASQLLAVDVRTHKIVETFRSLAACTRPRPTRARC